MTRIPGNAPIKFKPKDDMLTALLGAACVAMVIAIVVLVVRANTIFGGLFHQ